MGVIAAALLALLLDVAPACPVVAPPEAVVSCPGWITRHARVRDRTGRLIRSRSAVTEFLRKSGYPHGRPGYVVDHVRPLCAGGVDAGWNMQLQTLVDAKAKDRLERKECRR